MEKKIQKSATVTKDERFWMAHPTGACAWARDQWFDSEEGRRVLDATTLELPRGYAIYLRNRIELAFIAGFNVAEARHAAALKAQRQAPAGDMAEALPKGTSETSKAPEDRRSP